MIDALSSKLYLLKPPPRLSPLASFSVFAIMGAILGFLGADDPPILDFDPSPAPLPPTRLGFDKGGRPRLDNVLEGGVLKKAVPFLSWALATFLGGFGALLSQSLVDRLSDFIFL